MAEEDANNSFRELLEPMWESAEEANLGTGEVDSIIHRYRDANFGEP